jgi:hypothetical protein
MHNDLIQHSVQVDGSLRPPEHEDRTYGPAVLDLLVCFQCGALLPNDDYCAQLHVHWHAGNAT